MKKIDKLKKYREILFMCKKLLIMNAIDFEIERRIPTYSNSNEKVKVLTLFKKKV